MEVIYSERKYMLDQKANERDEVYVEIRRYTGLGFIDVVMEYVVRVDGEYVVCSKKCLDSGSARATLQREGIARFDELMDSHPAKNESGWKVASV